METSTTYNENLYLNKCNKSSVGHIKKVKGNVVISHDIDHIFMGELTTIEGNLSISADCSLMSLYGLRSLTSVGGSLKIYLNPKLTNLSGLEKLATVRGDLWIYNNRSLINLEALKNITIKGGYKVSGNKYNPTLKQLKQGKQNE